MKSSSFFKCIAVTAAMLAGSAQASIVHYDMTFTNGATASVTFDDTSASIGAGPFAPGATAYALTSFLIDGNAVANGEAVIYNDYGFSSDWLYFVSADGSSRIKLGGFAGIFSSEALTQLTDLTFADFGGASNPNNTMGVSGSTVAMASFVGGTTQAVPEPASLALLGMGLAGLAVARRRKSA